MSLKRKTIFDDKAMAQLLGSSSSDSVRFPDVPLLEPGTWIRVIRGYLRMTQTELARRAKVTQPHLVGIESGRVDPQVSTLRRIFSALSCDLSLLPKPTKRVEDVLLDRARAVAMRRLKHSMGTMALEGQAPSGRDFKDLLEKRAQEILNDRTARLDPEADE